MPSPWGLFAVPSIKSLAIAASVFGWALVLWKWVEHGPFVTNTAGYGVGLALGAGGLIVWALRDAARLYAIGYRDGCRARERV